MAKTARAAAMDLLAIREHSTQELQHKLSRRDFDQHEIDAALVALEQENLLSNARFTEAYITARMEKGMGPVRIQAELRERGIDDELIQRYLEPRDSLWDRQAERVRRKKFGARRPADFQARSRQARFLNYRGFTSEQIRQVLDTEPEIL